MKEFLKVGEYVLKWWQTLGGGLLFSTAVYYVYCVRSCCVQNVLNTASHVT